MGQALAKRDALDDKLRGERVRGHVSVGLGAAEPFADGSREVALVVLYDEDSRGAGPFPDEFEGLKVVKRPAPKMAHYGGKR